MVLLHTVDEGNGDALATSLSRLSRTPFAHTSPEARYFPGDTVPAVMKVSNLSLAILCAECAYVVSSAFARMCGFGGTCGGDQHDGSATLWCRSQATLSSRGIDRA